MTGTVSRKRPVATATTLAADLGQLGHHAQGAVPEGVAAEDEGGQLDHDEGGGEGHGGGRRREMGA